MKTLVSLQTGLRVHARRLVLFVGSGALAFLLILGGTYAPAGSFKSAIYLLVAGAALTATGKAFVDIWTCSEAYRQGAYTERAKAVQNVLALARSAADKTKLVLMLWPDPGRRSATRHTGPHGSRRTARD